MLRIGAYRPRIETAIRPGVTPPGRAGLVRGPVYDLRGITPTLDAEDPHLGLIQFKVGTGGRAVEYAGEWDLPLRPLIYRAFDAYMRRREQYRSAR